MNTFFLLAGGMAGLTMILHLWLGGREIAAPLLNSRDMHSVARYTNYFCWHMVSIVLAMMAGTFIWAAFRTEAYEAALVSTLLAAAFCVWNLSLVAWKKQSFLQMPQWALFAAILAFAVPGL